MRRRLSKWIIAGLLVLAAAGVWWQLSRPRPVPPTAVTSAHAQPQRPSIPTASSHSAPPSPMTLLSRAGAQTQDVFRVTSTNLLSYRLSNTDKTAGELARSEHAILMRNLLLDTARPAHLAIPAALRAQGNPGSYVVQARGPVDAAFRALLAEAGAQIVAYIPNNAFLVRLSAAGADQLRAGGRTRAVLAYEPYYKLNLPLLKMAVDGTPLPKDHLVNLTIFPGERENAVRLLEQMGAEIVAEDRTPFGPMLTVRPPEDGLVAMAGLPAVQGVETYHPRVAANDLTRTRLGVAEDTVTNASYLDLTGSNVLVNVNDSGVDELHPDLAGRVLALVPGALTDTNGHGTHVAGIIASSGGLSATVTNASGSVTNANFRGLAPNASIFALRVGFDSGPGRAGSSGALLSDSFLQEQPARTNAFISNNSWGLVNANEYNITASSYDAASRDALPGVPGSQPVLFVFAAGNQGFGNNSGQSGEAGSITSPGTAKNVITVGAIEHPRSITNDVIALDGSTNKPFLGPTDSDNQVLNLSSRGNVGIGIEGDFGRFKPDVVAPGSFAVSTRSTHWDENAYYNPTNRVVNDFFNQLVQPGELNQFSIFVPDNAAELRITIRTNLASPSPFPALPIYVNILGVRPTTNDTPAGFNQVVLPPDAPLPPGQTVFYAVGNNGTTPVSFDLRTTLVTTNDAGSNFFQVLSNLNQNLGPFYRYESGTSMSAAAVAGTLALMQEFFEQRAGLTNSPALMKALLINGSRSLGTVYDLNTRGIINLQGWGLVNLTNSLQPALTNLAALANSSVFLVDQSPTNALATGHRQTRLLSLTPNAQTLPLRVTLVWTDPPGNPAAGIKLVNDLDLVVTNLDTGDVYFGNDIPAGSDFTQAFDTNQPPVTDFVNNVENVFLPPLLGTNYSVTVIGRRVNVNAVTAHPEDVVQDYALVISSGDGELPDGIALTSTGPIEFDPPRPPTFIADNGIPLLNQVAGANTPLLGTTNGITNQWQFYVFTNTTSFTNVAFITFLPPSLSVPRIGTREPFADGATRPEADIDLYVSTNPLLINLDPAAIDAATVSRTRGGTESVVLSNALPGQVFYIGVKAEDYQAAEYGFLGVASEEPFGSRDSEGNLILRGIALPAVIPDGSPQDPGAALVFAIAPEPISVRRVVVTNTVQHEAFGDLLGNLSHGDKFVVLNNNTDFPGPPPGPFMLIYDDSDQGDITGSRPSDGPGSLRNFTGEEGAGVWLLTMVDNSLSQTGRIDDLVIRLEPQGDTNGTVGVVLPQRFFFDFVNVPPEATNLTVSVQIISGGSVDLFVRRDAFPTQALFDKTAAINPPGGSLSIGTGDTPPLNPGRYFIGVFNPNLTPVTVRIVTTVDLALTPAARTTFAAVGEVPLLDDAVTVLSQLVANTNRIARAEVGVRIEHERVSDLAMTLISPLGTRVLLAENRGGLSTEGFGFTSFTTNAAPPATNGLAAANTNTFDTGVNQGTLVIDYDFFNLTDQLKVRYDGVVIFDSGMTNGARRVTVNYGPGAATDITITVNEDGNTNATTKWEYTAFAVTGNDFAVNFTENTNLTTTPIKFAAPPFTNINFTGAPGLPAGIYYLPEQSLDALIGERAFGEWRLEIWDSRVGATNVAKLLNWRLDLTFEAASPTTVGLVDCVTVTNTLVGDEVKFFTVDVPGNAVVATNFLTGSNAVNLVFNQNRRPGTGPGDILLLSNTTDGSVVLTTNTAPPLVPGQRYFLAVSNSVPAGTNTFTLAVCFGTAAGVTNVILADLTNKVAFTNTIPVTNAPQHYRFTVSPGAVRAQFEILSPDGDVTLVARRGLPPPNLATFDYRSANCSTNDELITVFDFSAPVPLTPGDWFLGVVNVTTNPVTYVIEATEFTEYGTNLVITNFAIVNNEFCLEWTSLACVNYFVEGKTSLESPLWTPVSPTIRATNTVTPFCVPLPSPFQFFRVVDGLNTFKCVAPGDFDSITSTTNGFVLQWSGPVDQLFRVQWSPSVTPPFWQTFTNVFSSATGGFTFLDDGSQTGGLDPVRFYRLILSP